MKIKNAGTIIAAFLFFAGAVMYSSTPPSLPEGTKVQTVLDSLGADMSSHYMPRPDSKKVAMGRDLVHKGYTTLDGNKTKVISNHFVCTNCHNVKRENPDIADWDPQSRLEFTRQNGLPFLQGTTLYGAVDRETWYNDDYVKKYGAMAKKAKDSLREAIQLCARECSQGRRLKSRELEAILAYLNTIGLKIKDLDLTTNEKAQLMRAMEASSAQNKKHIRFLKSKYQQAAGATFVSPEKAQDSIEHLEGNASNGKAIYQQSCMHCHKPDGVTHLTLDNSQLTFRHLEKQANLKKTENLFQALRKGIPPKPGYKPYMPHYPLEKMSHQQMADLMAYIRKKAR